VRLQGSVLLGQHLGSTGAGRYGVRGCVRRQSDTPRRRRQPRGAGARVSCHATHPHAHREEGVLEHYGPLGLPARAHACPDSRGAGSEQHVQPAAPSPLATPLLSRHLGARPA
jgi:hypothetical protein